MKHKDEKRFWDNVDKFATGCWEWTASKSHGYGQCRFYGRQMGSHRASWILANGKIPNGLCVLHKCDNPPCVNPDHLFLGTQADNTADMVAKNRQAQGIKFSMAHRNNDIPKNPITSKREELGLTQDALADRLGVHRTTVNRWERGEIDPPRMVWEHIDGLEPDKETV